MLNCSCDLWLFKVLKMFNDMFDFEKSRIRWGKRVALKVADSKLHTARDVYYSCFLLA